MQGASGHVGPYSALNRTCAKRDGYPAYAIFNSSDAFLQQAPRSASVKEVESTTCSRRCQREASARSARQASTACSRNPSSPRSSEKLLGGELKARYQDARPRCSRISMSYERGQVEHHRHRGCDEARRA